MPFGNPLYYKGEYKPDKIYPLYIQRLVCSFEIKKNKLPTIQIKNNISFYENEYLTTSNYEMVELTLTNVDLNLFLENYNVYDLEFIDGYKFRQVEGLFSEYIDKWSKQKIKAKEEKNASMYTISKLMLNSLYGKFALNPKSELKIPYLENSVLHFQKYKADDRKPIYIPVGSFVTAYAREKTIRTSQAIKDYSLKKYGVDLYCYSDTDSIHTLLAIEDVKQFCNIDDYILGYWKHESTFTRAKFLRQKTYIEEIDGIVQITCAGLPEKCYKYVTWDNFNVGFKCPEKLTFKQLKGRREIN